MDRVDLGRRAARGTIWVGAGSWVNRLLYLVVLAVLATRLDPREFGVLSIAGLSRNLLVVLGVHGFADALVYQRHRVMEAARTAFLLAIITGAILALGLVISAPAVASFFHVPEASGPIRAYALIVATGASAQIPVAMLTRELQFGRRFVPEAVGSLVGGLTTIGLALGGTGVWSLVIGDAVREGLIFVLVLAVLPERFGLGWNRNVAAELWRYARRSMASEAFQLGLQNIDYVLVGRILGPAALGYYSLAFKVAIFPFALVTTVVAGVSFPYYARVLPDLTRARQAFRLVLRMGSLVSFLLGGGLIFLAPGLQVLGTRWEPSVATARALGVYVCLNSACQLITPLLTAAGYPGVDAVIRAGWFLLLACLIATVGAGGILAVGIVQAVVVALALAAYITGARRLLGVDPGGVVNDLARCAAAAAAGGAAVLALRSLDGIWVADTAWSTLVLLGVAFTCTFAVATWLLTPGVIPDIRKLRAYLR
jgi:O-antigen/teichoic acid export membrane protein